MPRLQGLKDWNFFILLEFLCRLFVNFLVVTDFPFYIFYFFWFCSFLGLLWIHDWYSQVIFCCTRFFRIFSLIFLLESYWFKFYQRIFNFSFNHQYAGIFKSVIFAKFICEVTSSSSSWMLINTLSPTCNNFK